MLISACLAPGRSPCIALTEWEIWEKKKVRSVCDTTWDTWLQCLPSQLPPASASSTPGLHFYCELWMVPASYPSRSQADLSLTAFQWTTSFPPWSISWSSWAKFFTWFSIWCTQNFKYYLFCMSYESFSLPGTPPKTSQLITIIPSPPPLLSTNNILTAQTVQGRPLPPGPTNNYG